MKRNKENSFTKKFDLLNSQNHNEDILWSSSESSDYENVNSNIHGALILNKHRKRKRKKIIQNNLSNLSFSVVTATRGNKKPHLDKSPIIGRLYLETKQCDEKSSPILSRKDDVSDAKTEVKSPVLLLKQKSSALSPTIKKRLFVDQSELKKIEYANVMTSEEIKQSSNFKIETKAKSISLNNNYAISSHAKEIYYSIEKPLKDCDEKVNYKLNNAEVLSTNNNVEEAIGVSKPRTKTDLMKRVQSYFDSQFGSDSASQQSISETETLTQKSDTKSSDDLEITNTSTQNNDKSPLPVYRANSTVSYGSWEVKVNEKKSKKTKYKKEGLAFRLDQLLKKQNANISLWQHEKFLAHNSKFVIPKSEHIVFRIQKVNFKYGCYLLETVDLNNERHLVFINGYYVNSACNLVADVVLKLYMPYKILDLTKHFKIVINVCKFECVSIVR